MEFSTSAEDQPGLKGETRIDEPTRAERALARRFAETRATVPDLELGVDVDAAAALEIARRPGCSLTAVLVAACAAGLREHPRANAAYRDGRYELYSRVNVAITVATADGYLAPTVLDADRKPVEQLSAEIETAGARARAGELRPPELAGATFTLWDMSAQPIARASGLVTPPQAAALAAGAVRPVPVLRDGAVEPGQEIALTLACDARILFGERAASFLASVAEHLRAPSQP